MSELGVATTTGEPVPISQGTLDRFRERFQGNVLCADDSRYDEARRVWNALVDHPPAVVARCAGAADVVAAVQFGREHELLVSMKGGSHNVAGTAVCEGGLMIDLSSMKGVRVDPAARTARAEPGVLGSGLDRETQAFGLATPVGTVSTTGIRSG